MYNFSDISFLIHIRKDSEERLTNLLAVLNYYITNCVNTEFIIIEDDKQQSGLFDVIKNQIVIRNNCRIKGSFFHNTGIYKRPLVYNLASRQTNRPLIISHDTDVIVHPEQIMYSSHEIQTHSDIGISIPYNGISLFVSPHVKSEFIKTNKYGSLTKYTPIQMTLLYRDDNVLIGNTQSVGGCVVFNHHHYKTFKGYNPNFIGWGYEDHEILKRANKLGFTIHQDTRPQAYLWHLPHEAPGSNQKEKDNPFYDNNRKLGLLVRDMQVDQLKEYIKSWNI